ncbi:MAG: hypothetical protein WCC06_06085 [Candidatus Aminicenantales bacterium]
MGFDFEWNEFADQPHNVAPRSERLRHHLRCGETYLALLASNLSRALPSLRLYRRYRKAMYRNPIPICRSCFAVSVSPAAERIEEILQRLKETGVTETLVRIPSWERPRLDFYENFLGLLRRQGFALTVAILQRREDVFRISAWHSFLEDVFSRLHPLCSFYEIGHAWNRTKWGVWDLTEYLHLARSALSLRDKYNVKLIGPAVIDFEFHLYPPVLRAIPFDKISSLLYVDRTGAPENAQAGWTTAMKVALLKAVADSSVKEPTDCWITEVNWPLQGTGKYSPASGRPNVTEDEQANYLVRYYIICLASGLIERVYWWQLVAPGYGLIDSRETPWRKRPSFFAFQTMVRILEGSIFIQKIKDTQAEVFLFRKGESDFAVCWTKGAPVPHEFSREVDRIVDRDGQEIPLGPDRVKMEGRPKYVFFK